VREKIWLGDIAQYFETGPCLRARIYHTQERMNARSEKTPGREISIGFFQRISHVISISPVWTFELIVERASWSPLVEAAACCCIPRPYRAKSLEFRNSVLPSFHDFLRKSSAFVVILYTHNSLTKVSLLLESLKFQFCILLIDILEQNDQNRLHHTDVVIICNLVIEKNSTPAIFPFESGYTRCLHVHS